jgi:hypothetical protein
VAADDNTCRWEERIQWRRNDVESSLTKCNTKNRRHDGFAAVARIQNTVERYTFRPAERDGTEKGTKVE